MQPINIFVSSTSEITEEIELVKDAANIISLLRPEITVKAFSFKDLHPSNGAQAQEIIYKQIGNNYDIYLGVLWKKYGSPTNNFDSGVIDEYEKAKSLGKKIMFYFNIQPPNSLNDYCEDITKVNKFKKKLGNENVLYHEYNGTAAFKAIIIRHLILQIEDINNGKCFNEKEVFDLDEESDDIDQFEIDPEYTNKLDFNDFIEDFESSLFSIGDLLKRTISIQKEFIQTVDIKYEKIQLYRYTLDKFKIKKIYLSISDDTKLFGDRVDVNIKGLNNNIDKLMTELNNSFLLFPEHKLSNIEKRELIEIGVVLVDLIKTYDDVLIEIIYLRRSLNLSSKLSHYLRKQNRIVEKKLIDLEQHIANYYAILKEYELEYINKINIVV